jgi:pimeloyl-[acyl-carrier protein] synthase
MTQTALPPFDFETAYRDGNPYPAYARYRTHEPVHVVEHERETGDPVREVFLFRHADCIAWLRDNRLGREHGGSNGVDAVQRSPGVFGEMAGMFMLFRDPPVHTRLRGVANMAFTPRQVERMRPQIEATARDLANDLRATGDGVDLIGRFAFPLPMMVIAGMLGIPKEDFRQFRRVAGDIAAAIDVPLEGLQDFIARVDESTTDLIAYLRQLIARRRRPDPRDDLLSQLIHAEADEGKLSEDELVATIILLIVAGHETTVNLIGNGTLALLRNPGQWRGLVREPGLARNAAEELLRFDAPVQFTGRVAKEAVEIGGHTIQPGSWVNFMLGSANRDELAFAEPDRLDIRRDVGRVMSFGMGIHFCLGAPLARMEGEIAFATLTREFPNLSLATDTPPWRPGAVFHGLQELPLRLG